MCRSLRSHFTSSRSILANSIFHLDVVALPRFPPQPLARLTWHEMQGGAHAPKKMMALQKLQTTSLIM